MSARIKRPKRLKVFTALGHMKCPEANAWLQGYAAALAEVNRLYDQPSTIKSVVVGAGLYLEDFKGAGVESYDLKQLRKALK